MAKSFSELMQAKKARLNTKILTNKLSYADFEESPNVGAPFSSRRVVLYPYARTPVYYHASQYASLRVLTSGGGLLHFFNQAGKKLSSRVLKFLEEELLVPGTRFQVENTLGESFHYLVTTESGYWDTCELDLSVVVEGEPEDLPPNIQFAKSNSETSTSVVSQQSSTQGNVEESSSGIMSAWDVELE